MSRRLRVKFPTSHHINSLRYFISSYIMLIRMLYWNSAKINTTKYKFNSSMNSSINLVYAFEFDCRNLRLPDTIKYSYWIGFENHLIFCFECTLHSYVAAYWIPSLCVGSRQLTPLSYYQTQLSKIESTENISIEMNKPHVQTYNSFNPFSQITFISNHFPYSMSAICTPRHNQQRNWPNHYHWTEMGADKLHFGTWSVAATFSLAAPKMKTSCHAAS